MLWLKVYTKSIVFCHEKIFPKDRDLKKHLGIKIYFWSLNMFINILFVVFEASVQNKVLIEGQ